MLLNCQDDNVSSGVVDLIGEDKFPGWPKKERELHQEAKNQVCFQ